MIRSKWLGGALLATACLVPAVLLAQSLPFHQRTGLWLVQMTIQGKPSHGKQCISEESLAFQEKFSASVRKRNNCTANQITHNPDGSWSDTYTCTFGNRRTTAHSTFRGDFNSKFTATMTPGQGDSTTSVFTYAGPCPAGMHGGDVEMNGRVMNMMTMMQGHH